MCLHQLGRQVYIFTKSDYDEILLLENKKMQFSTAAMNYIWVLYGLVKSNVTWVFLKDSTFWHTTIH